VTVGVQAAKAGTPAVGVPPFSRMKVTRTIITKIALLRQRPRTERKPGLGVFSATHVHRRMEVAIWERGSCRKKTGRSTFHRSARCRREPLPDHRNALVTGTRRSRCSFRWTIGNFTIGWLLPLRRRVFGPHSRGRRCGADSLFLEGQPADSRTGWRRVCVAGSPVPRTGGGRRQRCRATPARSARWVSWRISG